MFGAKPLFLALMAGGMAWGARAQQVSETGWAMVNRMADDSQKVELLLKEGGRNTFRPAGQKQDHPNPFFQQALAISGRINYPRGVAEAYDRMGVEKRENSEYLLAISYHEKSLQVARSLKNPQLIATALNDMGVAYRRLDENQKAFACHLEALQMAEKTGDLRNITIATNSIGNIELSLGKYQDAIDQFNRSLEMETQQRNRTGIAINLANLGLAYEGLGQIDKAIEDFRKSLVLNLEDNNPKGIAICYNSLGEAYQMKNNFPLALAYFQQAIAANGEASDRIDVSQNYLSRGNLLLKMGRFRGGVNNLDTALQIARQIGSKSLAMSALSALGNAWREKGDYGKALADLQGSLLLKDSIINEKSALRLSEMQALYELDRKDNQIKLLEEQGKIRQLQSRRNWFIALIALVVSLCGTVAGFFYMRHRELQSHRHALELELRSLRSQMNPHFIFNSLNSIHKYIWSNQTEEASQYLTKFSRLMRMILENTQHAQVLLSKELQTLSLYLELECLRCNNKFIYKIEVDPAINQDDVMIPPLIIQPFVENAIWHGLVHLDGTGELIIQIGLQNNLFVCTVSDNGIGRKRAMEIRDRKGMAHQSMGMKMTQERINLTSVLSRNKETNIEITDMQDAVGSPAGTRVTMRLPAEFLY